MHRHTLTAKANVCGIGVPLHSTNFDFAAFACTTMLSRPYISRVLNADGITLIIADRRRQLDYIFSLF